MGGHIYIMQKGDKDKIDISGKYTNIWSIKN